MQCGSTGLGKMALKMKLANKADMKKLPVTEPPKGSLIMYCKSHDPVIWYIWASIEPEDIWPVIKIAFSRDAIWFTLGAIFKSIFTNENKAQKEIKTESLKMTKETTTG